jgi:nitroreductase
VKPINPTIETIQAHRTIRSFTEQPIAEQHLTMIIQCAQAAPSASMLQAYSIIHVSDPQTKETLSILAGNQNHVRFAPVLLIFCADLYRLKQAANKHNKPFEAKTLDSLLTATVDTTVAAQNALVAAQSLGLGGCYISGVRDEPNQVRDLLQLPELVYPVIGLCLGYPANDPGQKLRLPMQVILKENVYTTEREEERIEAYESQIDELLMKKINKHLEPWSLQTAKVLEKPMRPSLRSFITEQKFGLE